MLLAGVVFAVLAGLMVNWTLLATIYFLPVWLVGFFLNRDLNFRESWRLAGASLIPGALILTLAIFVYGLALIDPVQLIAVFVAHFVIGWIYFCIAPFFTSKKAGAVKSGENPFVK